MAGLPRPAAAAPTRKSSMRPPIVRPSSSRSQSAAPPASRHGAISPAESSISTTTTTTTTPSKRNGTKRKERDFEHEGGEETNINVVVRCRGRNEREVRENSGVVLLTDGVRGKSVELSMGPSALSNKTYHFDKVFSPAADQAMIYDDVVTPILDEMLEGYNCTIFAYGQTGTGKTYTMSGDMSNTFGMLSDAAGIIPRTLYALFNKLELDDAESSVKCSFIELYNEELRDLVSVDDGTKLKIYEDNSKKGHSGTIVQGMEECYIKSAVEGVELLQNGSHKRQVAATKCNDLSSRSHTVFTITSCIKRVGENGEDYLKIGKLNLVDLAGSENIQRSGAENKRAAEAGLINKSLLTLGRVINALVEKSSHIPYRESKLTRLLQDSLGGRTKTCIIATVSPAKSNLEETISTLDYAFRAKNIRNKPQVNQMVNKKTLLKEFTMEIEKLKGELIATRQRNGIYLTTESYEEITVESESRRILSEEQASIIETMEAKLKKQLQELFSLTTNFVNMKKTHETTVVALDETRSVLDQTEFVLTTTRQSLAEEALLRKAHQATEERLNDLGTELISTLSKTVGDVGGLHSKLRRRSDLQSLNRNTWGLSQAQVADVTTLVETRVEEFRTQQEDVMAGVSSRMQSFVNSELTKLAATQQFLKDNVSAFELSGTEVTQQTEQAKTEMDAVLEEIKVLREEVKSRVGEGLKGLSVAAERISEEVINELGAFHTQLHSSYSSLGKDFKNMLEELLRHINSQKEEAENLRQQMAVASDAAIQANVEANALLETVLAEERRQTAADRQILLSQITSLIMTQGEMQDARISEKISIVQGQVSTSRESFQLSRSQYDHGMDAWNENGVKLVDDVLKSREALKSKLKEDWMTANKHNASLQAATKSVHEETVRIVDEQMKDIGGQMQALDDFVTRAQLQNAEHHDQHAQSLKGLSTTVLGSYAIVGSHFTASYERVRDIGNEMSAKTAEISAALSPLDTTLRQPLAELRANIASTKLGEYVPTGETPQKVQYLYPTELPRTDAHDTLLASIRGEPTQLSNASPSKSNTMIYHDPEIVPMNEEVATPASLQDSTTPTGGLREINSNISVGIPGIGDQSVLSNSTAENMQTAMFKRSIVGTGLKVPQKVIKKPSVVSLEGRENSIQVFSQSTSGRRRSPRTTDP